MCKSVESSLINLKTLTSTSNCHQVSTLFAIVDISPMDQEWFCKHMGHSKEIHKCQYEVSRAIVELTKVAKYLVEIDGKITRVSS